MVDLHKRALNLDQILQKKPDPRPDPVHKVTSPELAQKAPALVKRERRVQAILNSIDQLPSLPAVVWEVMRLANDPDSNAKDFEDYISKDQALTAKLLKLVNSSFYGLPNKMTTISRSIVVLGYKTLKSVVMAASTSKLLDRQLQLYGYGKGGLWMHSIACAGVTRHLAKTVFKLGSEIAEEAFVAGLLHDIGKIIISPVLTENVHEFESYIDLHQGCSMIAAEAAVAGIDHAEAGKLMMQKWKLSERLTQSIADHHNSSESQAGHTRLNQIVELGDLLCLQLGLGLADNYPWRTEVPDELLLSLGLSKDDLVQISAEVVGLEEDIQALMGSLRN